MKHLYAGKCSKAFVLFSMFLMSCLTVLAQGGEMVSGKVTGDGEPLPGATVMEKGTTNGTVTDIDGNFRLEVTNDAVLVVSFVGYQSLERSVDGQTEITFSLQPDVSSLEEVVVVAYGEQSKQKMTGSVQKVSSEELQELPVAQVTQKLQGKLAGVQINQTTGTPGGGMSVRIRGQASISAGSDPLYVVDGFPITGDISNMNPDEIESITVLKDASSTSLYGSRAANGVVIVTTKRAKGRDTEISFSSYYGIQQIPEKGRPDMMNAQEYGQFKKEYYEQNGQPVPELFQNPEELGEGTNWFDLITRDAPIENYSLSIKGSTGNLRTSVVAGYFKQKGVLLNSEFERISLRANMDYSVNDRVRVGANIAPTFTNRKSPQTDGVWYVSGGILQGAILTPAIFPHVNEDGTVPYSAGTWGDFGTIGTIPMPNWYHQVQAVKNTSKNTGLLSNLFLEAEVLPGLTYKVMAGVDVGNSVGNGFTPSTAGGVFNPGNPDDPNRISGYHNNSFGYSWMLENTLKYAKSVGDHDFDVLVGYTTQAARGESASMSGAGFPDNRVQTLNAATTITGTTDIQEWSLASVVGRVNYSFQNKYLVSAALRADGSSKFGAQNRWGNFPSISAGWVISEESFMADLPTVSFLKLRASYGITGNNNVGNYTQYASVVSTNNPFNDVLYGGKSLAGLNNEGLGWERTAQTDIGVEVGLFNDRVSFSYDYYSKMTTDLLYTVEIPISSGFYNFATNVGDFKFWGHEFVLSTKNLTGPVTWNTDFNIAFNKNEALKLGTEDAPLIIGGPAGFVRNLTQVGQPIGQLYGLQADGLFINQSEYDAGPLHNGAGVGSIRFVDQDGDGTVTNDERDWTIIGNTAPKFIYGFTNTFAYKNFDLTVVAQGAVGHKVVNTIDRFAANLDGNFNVVSALDNRWRSESDPGDGRYGTVTPGTTGPERDWFHSKFVYDASYLTIQNITLGYNLPVDNMDFIGKARVYTSIQRAFVLTDYPGGNPEVSAAGGVSAGADNTTYPVPRTYSLGVNLTF
ncbi:SusC/RagA family TonB-linked outer membrane protein [Marinoscillum sp.]|uniref:SusC/RagA family TonB-linked outer membrane protein n=1 Tax=Marinoscillum sp. TaxID=2024838 RepID=UPI003BA984AD